MFVYRGTFEPTALGSELEDQGFEAAASIDGTPTFQRETSWVWAVSEEFLINVWGGGDPEYKRDLLRWAVRAQLGEIRSYATGNDEFATVVDRLQDARGQYVYTRSVGEQLPNESHLVDLVGEYTAHGSGEIPDGDRVQETEVLVYPSAERINRSGLEEFADVRRDAVDSTNTVFDLSTSVDGRVGGIEVEREPY